MTDTTVNTQIEPLYTKHFLKSKTMWFSAVLVLLGAILEMDQLQDLIALLPGDGALIGMAIIAAISAGLRAITVKPVHFKRRS